MSHARQSGGLNALTLAQLASHCEPLPGGGAGRGVHRQQRVVRRDRACGAVLPAATGAIMG
jgi:hypothetical protein